MNVNTVKIRRIWKICRKHHIRPTQERIKRGAVEVFDLPENAHLLRHGVIHDLSEFDDWYAFYVDYEIRSPYELVNNESVNGIVEQFL